jgi:hypothetical protein
MSLGQFSKAKYSPSLKLKAAAELELRRRASRADVGVGVPVWTPQDGPQVAAYTSDADVLGYGGQAGGGKSDVLIGLAGTQHWRSIIFRREFPRVRELIERSREIFNARGLAAGKDSFNEQTHLWRLSDDRQIEFAAMQYEKDKLGYQGRPKDFYGFDEATEFSESQIRFVIGWNRSTHIDKRTNKPQRCRVVLGFNPPMTAEGEWIIAFFLPWLAYLFPDQYSYPHPAAPGELRWFAQSEQDEHEHEVAIADLAWYVSFDGSFWQVETDDLVQRGAHRLVPQRGYVEDGKLVTAKSRTFIPASLKDNPILEATGYGATVNAMPEPYRSLLRGQWGAGKVEDPWQVIPTAWIKLAQARWTFQQPDDALLSVGVDVARGGKDKTVIAKLYGKWFAPLDKYPGASTPDGPTVAALALPYSNALCGLFVDVIGVGGAVYDALKGHARVAGVNFAEGAPMDRDKSGKLKFRNVRAMAYWRLREALDPHTGDGLALPPDPELEADLKAAKWSLTTGGILIESKEDIQERIGRSPDSGDAVALAYYGIKQRKNSAVGAFAR